MQKSIRLFALTAALSLTAATSLHAEQMGTNPHPWASRPTGTFSSVVYTVRSFFGL